MKDDRDASPLALAVLREEIEAIEAEFEQLLNQTDAAAGDARRNDLAAHVDRHLHLEEEILYPVLERNGISVARAREGQASVHAALAELAAEKDMDRARIEAVRTALRAHSSMQERTILAEAQRALPGEMAPLGLELDEARLRLRGTYGV